MISRVALFGSSSNSDNIIFKLVFYFYFNNSQKKSAILLILFHITHRYMAFEFLVSSFRKVKVFVVNKATFHWSGTGTGRDPLP